MRLLFRCYRQRKSYHGCYIDTHLMTEDVPAEPEFIITEDSTDTQRTISFLMDMSLMIQLA